MMNNTITLMPIVKNFPYDGNNEKKFFTCYFRSTYYRV